MATRLPGSVIVMAEWHYNPDARRFRDPTTGRFISQARLVELHDKYAATRAAAMADLADELAAGSLDVPTWETLMRDEVKLAHGAQYLLGRGGRQAMAPVDWRHLETLVRTQMQYLTNYARAVADGKLSAAQVRWRSQLYAHAARQTFERALATSWNLDLPAYPADGGTPCRARCHCHWNISVVRRRVVASWRLGAAEHCGGCIDRAVRYRAWVVQRAQAA